MGFGVLAFHILEQPAALAHFFQKAAAARVVFFVALQMRGQFLHLFAQNGDLYLRRPGIFRMRLKLLDDRLFFVFVQHRTSTVTEWGQKMAAPRYRIKE